MDFLSSKNLNFSTSPQKTIWAAGKNGKWADKELSKWAGGLLGKLADGRASCSLSSQLLSPLIPSYPLLSYPVSLLSLLSPLPHLQSQVVPSECIPYSSNLNLSPLIIVVILYHPLSSLITPYHPSSSLYPIMFVLILVRYHLFNTVCFLLPSSLIILIILIILYHPLSSFITPYPIICFKSSFVITFL